MQISHVIMAAILVCSCILSIVLRIRAEQPSAPRDKGQHGPKDSKEESNNSPRYQHEEQEHGDAATSETPE